MSVGDVEPPTAILWVYHFLAQHFDYLRDCKRAMEFIDKALDHTPTLIEAYMVKARIYKVNLISSNMLLLYLSFIVLNEMENFEALKCILFVLKKTFHWLWESFQNFLYITLYYFVQVFYVNYCNSCIVNCMFLLWCISIVITQP